MPRLDESARGVYLIAVTPFSDSGALDLERADRMVDFYLERGADGAMTGFAYPEMMVDVVAAHARGDVERAHDIFDAYLPLARYEQQPNVGLAVRKYLLARRGAIASAMIRKPGPSLSAADIADVERLVRRQDKRLQELA